MVSVKVYNINGQLVETMVDEYYNVGEYTINWNGNSQPSGVYLVRMESGEFVQTQKVILLKWWEIVLESFDKPLKWLKQTEK